jgi:hypothetical protein
MSIKEMTQIIFKVASEEIVVTRERIFFAMKEYDKSRRVSNSDAGRKYAIKYNGMFYPPKRILSIAIKRHTSTFSGGKGKTGANQIFLDLGFEIVNIGRDVSTSSFIPTSSDDQSKINTSIPKVQDLIAELFSQKWTNLHTSFSNLEDGIYPGVYVLAYSDRNLKAEYVKVEDVFYVGMTHAGIYKRLKQFIKGIEENDHHSGACRFYKEYARNIPYSSLPNRKTFFVASVAIPCIVDKRRRSPMDLRKMGEVVRLELYVLAHIKEKLQREPELNKK